MAPSCGNVVRFLGKFCRSHEHCVGPTDAEAEIVSEGYELGCRCDLEKMALKLRAKMKGLQAEIEKEKEKSSEEDRGKEDSIEVIKMSNTDSSAKEKSEEDHERDDEQ